MTRAVGGMTRGVNEMTRGVARRLGPIHELSDRTAWCETGPNHDQKKVR